MDCIEKCEFQEFCYGIFYCKLYNVRLSIQHSKDDKIMVNRYSKCTDEEIASVSKILKKMEDKNVRKF